MSEEKDLQQPADEEKNEEKATEETAATDEVENSDEESTDDRRQRLNETLGNLEDGARAVGEKTSILAGQVFEKIKQGVSQAYEAGSKVVGELSDTASDYAEQYKTSAEIKKLNGEKNALIAELGSFFYSESRKQNATWEEIAGSEMVGGLFQKISALDEQIIEVGKRLDSRNEDEG